MVEASSKMVIDGTLTPMETSSMKVDYDRSIHASDAVEEPKVSMGLAMDTIIDVSPITPLQAFIFPPVEDGPLRCGVVGSTSSSPGKLLVCRSPSRLIGRLNCADEPDPVAEEHGGLVFSDSDPVGLVAAESNVHSRFDHSTRTIIDIFNSGKAGLDPAFCVVIKSLLVADRGAGPRPILVLREGKGFKKTKNPRRELPTNYELTVIFQIEIPRLIAV
ncbi:glycine-rich protein 1-like [Iris pallida]|uniref:Glycine-rich protein 1-like n=1 Tax=Iris pallida TaxID=29817 RepID=A0AAX6H1L9_IRIPA|nr:glycine-rich protein 1-like [Iris pallida]